MNSNHDVNSHLSKIPEEVGDRVFYYLDKPSLLSARQSCQFFKKIADRQKPLYHQARMAEFQNTITGLFFQEFKGNLLDLPDALVVQRGAYIAIHQKTTATNIDSSPISLNIDQFHTTDESFYSKNLYIFPVGKDRFGVYKGKDRLNMTMYGTFSTNTGFFKIFNLNGQCIKTFTLNRPLHPSPALRHSNHFTNHCTLPMVARDTLAYEQEYTEGEIRKHFLAFTNLADGSTKTIKIPGRAMPNTLIVADPYVMSAFWGFRAMQIKIWKDGEPYKTVETPLREFSLRLLKSANQVALISPQGIYLHDMTTFKLIKQLPLDEYQQSIDEKTIVLELDKNILAIVAANHEGGDTLLIYDVNQNNIINEIVTPGEITQVERASDYILRLVVNDRSLRVDESYGTKLMYVDLPDQFRYLSKYDQHYQESVATMSNRN